MPRKPFLIRGVLSVRRSGIHGRGVYARIPIPAGVRLVEYTGRRMDEEEADFIYPEVPGQPYHTFLFAIDDGVVIDANVGGSIAKWINHSCDPNCDAVIDDGHVYIESIRDIEAGEELSYDYNFILHGVRHSPAAKKRYPCICGAPNCRGTMLAKKR